MAKESKKQQQQVQTPPTDSKPNLVIQQTISKTTSVEEVVAPKEDNNNDGEIQIKCMKRMFFFKLYLFCAVSVKPLQISGNKSSANSFTSTNADLQVAYFISI